MWKRDEAVRPATGQPTAAAQPAAPTQAGASGPRPAEASHQMEKDIVNIGKSVVIKGELNGSEDLTIEGHVEGTIQLKEHVRSEEHTSELQSHSDLVCRLLLE